MSEKLERVKSRQDELIKLLPHDLYLDVYYLYEQAERVEELEEKLKHQTDHRLSVENNNLKRENQRYREAIEKTLDSMSGYDLFKYGDDLEKALEEVVVDG